MVNPVGPVYTNRFEEFVVNDENGEEYTILYLADLNNDKLQAEGKPPAYYWVPGTVRMSRKGDTGDYKFRHVHFVGVFNEDLHAGVEGNSEVTGGLLAFTTTSRYPTSVLAQAEAQLLDKFRGDSDKYWGWRTPAAPQFAMAPITSNTTLITSLTPGRDGTAPVEGIGTPAAPSGGTAPPGGRNLVRRVDPNQQVIHGRNFRSSSAIDAWAWNLQGQGPGSVTGGENAYAGMIGPLASELVWAGFHGGYSPIAVVQNLIMPVWSQEIYIRIEGDWDRIFQHFSGHANAGYRWFAADVKAEFNQLRISGGIEVEVHVDGTIPDGADMAEEIDARIDMIVDKFMQQATQVIFEPAPPEVEPAEAPSGGFLSRFFGGGGGFALKYRRDEQHLNLHYEETRHHRYNQPTTISSSLEGFFNEIKADPEAEQKYFTRLVLGDLSRKVTRIVKPVVNWPDPAKEWVGEPAAFLSVEIGYPDNQGHLQWLPHVFQSTDTSSETTWKPAFALRQLHEVNNPPSEWTPEKTFVRRRVHLTEPAGATDNPYVQLLVEKNEILLDLDENGTLMDGSIVEVRADSVGKLEVRMTGIDATLQDPSQVVEVEFRILGRTHDGHERPIVRFSWHHHDQDQSRYLEVFTGQLDYVPRYEYRVTVTVKGTIFSRGMSWTGPWTEGQGNGDLMIRVPRPDEAGVTTRRLTPREVSLGLPPAGEAAPESGPESKPETLPAPPPTTVGAGSPDGSSNGGSALSPPPSTRTVSEREKRQVAGFDVTEPEAIGAPPSDRTASSKAAERDDREPAMAEATTAGPELVEGWVEF